MGPVHLPLEAREVVQMLKEKILTSPLLAFPDFAKPFLLETDASKEGLGAVISQKQDDGRFHPVTFGSRSLTPAEKNYHSSKLEFLVLKWGTMEHFREYLAYALFVVKTDNNPLTYILTTLNLDATGHRWVGALASFEFELEYQKGSENGAANALSRVPIQHDHRTVKSLMEGAVMGTSSTCEAQASDALRKEYEWLREEARLQATKLAPMHVVDWVESQDSDPMLATCKKWLRTHKEVLSPKRDTLLHELIGRHMEGEGCTLFRVRNSLILDKDLLYLDTTPKVLKNDPALRDLEYVQVDNAGTTYLFFLDKQCHHGLPAEAAEMLGAYLPGAFSELISCLAHFAAVAIPLAEGRHLASVGVNSCHQRLRTDPQGPALGTPFSSESDVGPVLVGSAPPTPVKGERGAEGERVSVAPASRARGRPPKKAHPIKEMPANSPPSLLDRGGADSDAASMASETSYHSRPRQRHRREKHLAPAKLDLPIFKSMDPSTDVTYMIWRFDVQSWLEQYTKESRKPHIYASLRGYPGHWVCSLEGREHLTLTELLHHMDRAFGEVSEVDVMIRSMYEIRQAEKETMEEYMLHIHEAVVVIQHAYPGRLTNQDKNFLRNHFYNSLLP